MHRLRLLLAALIAAPAIAAAPAGADLCDVLHTCPAPPGPALDPDGALHVDTAMAPLPAPLPGGPLLERVDGHLQLGLTERGYDGSPNGFGRAATAAQEAAFVRGIGGALPRGPASWGQAEPHPPPGGGPDHPPPRAGPYPRPGKRGGAP